MNTLEWTLFVCALLTAGLQVVKDRFGTDKTILSVVSLLMGLVAGLVTALTQDEGAGVVVLNAAVGAVAPTAMHSAMKVTKVSDLLKVVAGLLLKPKPTP